MPFLSLAIQWGAQHVRTRQHKRENRFVARVGIIKVGDEEQGDAGGFP